ncbi:MAG: c-type cytochrome [Thermoleophilaceae bacterium]
MEIIAFLLPFVLLGAAVVFIAFSGGPGQAREAYLARGNAAFKVGVPLAVLVLGIGVPALVTANRGEAEGGTGPLRTASLTTDQAEGKQLFRDRCASCHSLAAVNARGVTGPNLDQIGEVTPQRVRNAIRIGGTGEKRMPAGLLDGPDAENVAKYVSKVAGR